MEIIKNFGIDPILLIAQIVNFLIVLFILRKFLYKPVLSQLQKRQNTIKDGLKQAEEARIRLEKVQEDEKNILRKAQIEAKKLLDDTKKESLIMLQRTEEQTKIQADRIIKEAKQQIYFETRGAEKRLTIYVSKLAIEFLQRSVADLFSKDDQKAVMKNVLEKLKNKVN